jgi:peptide/nickel transport system permease protein
LVIALLVRRTLSLVLVLIGVSIITFTISHVIPGNPAAAAAGANASPEQIAAVNRRLGLDKPLPEQYAIYLKRLLHGDFGESIVSAGPVSADFTARLPSSAELAIAAILLYIPLGIALGILSARAPGRWTDVSSRVFAVLGVSVPVFWLALVAQLLFSGHWHWLPSTGRLGSGTAPPPHVTGFFTIDAVLAGKWGTLRDALRHLVMPAVVLAVTNLAVLARMTRSSMLEVLGQDYIRTARAKGLSETRLLTRHALKNALIPVVTVIAVQMAGLIAWQFLVEYVYSWPGIGSWAVAGITNSDFNVVMMVALFGAALYVFLNFLADVAYIVLDPRLRDATD